MNLTITKKGLEELKRYNKQAKIDGEYIYNLKEDITEQLLPCLEIKEEKNEKEIWYKTEGSSDWEQIENNKVNYCIDQEFNIEFVLN